MEMLKKKESRAGSNPHCQDGDNKPHLRLHLNEACVRKKKLVASL